MSSLDLNNDYNKVKDKINANKSYTDLKNKYKDAEKKVSDSLEKGKDALSDAKENFQEGLDKLKTETKRYQTQIKNQFEQLLDISAITGGQGSNSTEYIKRLMIKTIFNIKPQIKEIVLEELIRLAGCDQEQTFEPIDVYIKVKTIDLAQLLKRNPNEKAFTPLYEKSVVQIQNNPFSLNRELYHRIQNPTQSYFQEYGQYYKGQSGQDLFDIQYTDLDNFGAQGPWFKITLQNRPNGVNRVREFLSDYYSSIQLVEVHTIMANIMNSLSGAISIEGNIGLVAAEDATKFEKIMTRVLGLCFDNRKEIEVSGIAKVPELDGVDDSFFEFNEIELRNINEKVDNIKNKVVEFLDCSTEKLPVNSAAIVDSLNKLIFIEGTKQEEAANNLTNVLADNPEWEGFAIRGNIRASVNLNFIQLLSQGLIFSLLGPKFLLGIFVILKALKVLVNESFEGFMDFMKIFKKFMINVISRVGAIFVKELFNLIKKDIKNLLQQIIKDLVKEQADKRIIIILKLIQLLITVAQFIRDWRECKSVVDEILWLLRIATSGLNNQIPLPLLFASNLLDGFSTVRAYIGTIEELQKIGISTGDMPDGSPNLYVLSMLAQLKGSANEESENGKVQIAIPPLSMTPAGITIPQSAYGKKM